MIPKGRLCELSICAGLFVASFFIAFLFVFGGPSFDVLSHRIPHDLGDPLLNFWILEQVRLNIIESRGLFTGDIFFPHHSTLAFSEGLWIPYLLYQPLRSLLPTPIFAYNTLVLSFFSLNFVAMYYFMRRFSSAVASAIAALIFSFSMVRLAQMSHMQLLPQFFFPLTAGAIWDYESCRKGRFLVLALLYVVGQFYSCVYLGMILTVTLIPYFVDRSFRTDNKKLFLRHIIVSSVVALALLAPLGTKYVSISREHKMVRPISEAHIFGAHVTHFYAAAPGSFWGPITEPILKAKGQLHEKRLFVGLFVLFLMGIAIRGRRRGLWWNHVLFFTFLLVIVLAMGPQARLYNLFYYGFPGMQGLRVPARFGLAYLFLCALLAGIGVDILIRGWKSIRTRQRVPILFVGIFLFENNIPAHFEPIPQLLMPVSQKVRELPSGEAIVHLPLNTLDTLRMYFGLYHGHKIFNGHSGFNPEPQKSLVKQEADKGPSSEILKGIQRQGVRYAVVEKKLAPAAVSAKWDEILRSQKKLLWENEGTALFEL